MYNINISKTIDHIQIMMKKFQTSTLHPTKPQSVLNDMELLGILKVNTESQNLYYGCMKDY